MTILVGCGGDGDGDSEATAPSAEDTPTPQPTSTPEVPTPTPEAKSQVGVIIEAGGSAYRVNSIIDDYEPEFFAADPGNRFFVFDVTQTGLQDEEPFGHTLYSVQTEDDLIWGCSSPGGAPEPPLSTGELAMGQRVRGHLACEIPSDALVVAILTQAEDPGPNVPIADLTLGTEAAEPYPVGDPLTGPALGDTTEHSGSKYTVNFIEDFAGGPTGFAVAIDITQEGVAPIDDFNGFHFYVQTTDDFHWDCSGMEAPDPAFSEGFLEAGQTVRGWITCSVLRGFQDIAPIAAVYHADFFGTFRQFIGGSTIIALAPVCGPGSDPLLYCVPASSPR